MRPWDKHVFNHRYWDEPNQICASCIVKMMKLHMAISNHATRSFLCNKRRKSFWISQLPENSPRNIREFCYQGSLPVYVVRPIKYVWHIFPPLQKKMLCNSIFCFRVLLFTYVGIFGCMLRESSRLFSI